jgi:hypothetical protein
MRLCSRCSMRTCTTGAMVYGKPVLMDATWTPDGREMAVRRTAPRCATVDRVSPDAALHLRDRSASAMRQERDREGVWMDQCTDGAVGSAYCSDPLVGRHT